ncbi:unnamed protein product, partial [Mesorhabditis spiculigera]
MPMDHQHSHCPPQDGRCLLIPSLQMASLQMTGRKAQSPQCSTICGDQGSRALPVSSHPNRLVQEGQHQVMLRFLHQEVAPAFQGVGAVS